MLENDLKNPPGFAQHKAALPQEGQRRASTHRYCGIISGERRFLHGKACRQAGTGGTDFHSVPDIPLRAGLFGYLGIKAEGSRAAGRMLWVASCLSCCLACQSALAPGCGQCQIYTTQVGTQVSCSPWVPGKAGRDAGAGGLTSWTLPEMGTASQPPPGLTQTPQGVWWPPRGAWQGDGARRNGDRGSSGRSGSDAGLQRLTLGIQDPQVHPSPPPRRFPSCRPPPTGAAGQAAAPTLTVCIPGLPPRSRSCPCPCPRADLAEAPASLPSSGEPHAAAPSRAQPAGFPRAGTCPASPAEGPGPAVPSSRRDGEGARRADGDGGDGCAGTGNNFWE